MLMSEEGSGHSGAVEVAEGGKCVVRWENATMFAFSGIILPRTLAYQIAVVPHGHTALARARELVELASHGTAAEIISALGDLPADVADEHGLTPLHGAAPRVFSAFLFLLK